jgi:hypothetical protein
MGRRANRIVAPVIVLPNGTMNDFCSPKTEQKGTSWQDLWRRHADRPAAMLDECTVSLARNMTAEAVLPNHGRA